MTCLLVVIAVLGQWGSAPPGDAGQPLAGGMLAPLWRQSARGTVHRMPDHVMNYIESDALAELTLSEWRRVRAAASPRRRRSLRSRLAVRPRLAFA